MALLGAPLDSFANHRTFHCNPVTPAFHSRAHSIGTGLQRTGQGKCAGQHRSLFPHPQSDLRFWQPDTRGPFSLGESAKVAVLLRRADTFAGLQEPDRGACACRKIWRSLSGLQTTYLVLIQLRTQAVGLESISDTRTFFLK